MSLEDNSLEELLQNWKMEAVLPYLEAAHVTYNSLKYLKKDDFVEAIPPLGLRVEFREKVFAWKKEKFGIDEDTLSMVSNIQSWLNSNSTSPQSVSYSPRCVLKKELSSILNENSKGRAIVLFEKQNKKLLNFHRDELINIIVEEAMYNNIKIKVQDFPLLLDEILKIFPCEKPMKDYYFISRTARKNPSGKLFSKYRNNRSKKLKFDDSFNEKEENVDLSTPEIDNTVAIALKTSLIRDCDDWGDVCEKWAETFHVRQKDLKELDGPEFLKNWTKLSNARADKLIEIDFDILYPGKNHLLLSKWNDFKCKIMKFYEHNFLNEYCKRLYIKCKTTTNTDAQDYLITILLCAVLPSSARFKDESGKRYKRATIADSMECLSLHLITLDNYNQKLNCIVNKYYSSGMTIQPFIIVVGISESELASFYVYFNGNLLKFNSFIESLDTCFKIFQVLSLEYPLACQEPWLVLQQFLFDIHTPFDVKSSKLTTLLSYLNN